MILFVSERLLFRRFGADDVDAMVAIYGDRETMTYVGDANTLAAKDCFQWIEITDRNFELRGYGMAALEDRASGEVVGFMGIVHPGQQLAPEIKYAFRRDHWGQGYATEAVAAMVGHARSRWGFDRIVATVHPGNTASQRVLEKVGFGRVRDRVEEDGPVTQVWEWAGSTESEPVR